MASSSVPVLGKAGKKIGTVKVAAAFTRPASSALLHQSVVRELANKRGGTASTKKRDEVAGGGRKPWRQKGTGRARQGSIRSPLWRKGGVVFGPQPRSFRIALNRKARRAALAGAIASKLAQGALSVLDPADLGLEKTKDFIALAWPGNASADRVLVIVQRERDAEPGAALARTARNARRATVVGHDATNVHALLAHDRILVTKNAYEALAEACDA